MKISTTLSVISLVFLLSCGNGQRSSSNSRSFDASEAEMLNVEVPTFNKDSAYYYVEKQVSFGPRVPNTQAHRECGDWLHETLGRFADTVYVQNTRVRAYDGTVLSIRNFIGSFQPELTNRILLCGHWDSRPWADHDPDPANHYAPVPGANDGASSIGVLLEIARQLKESSPRVGIDIIFFDAEDYGQHRTSPGQDRESWALGSQFWATTPHRPDYNARFGILLDMVGAPNPTFKREGYSMMFAPQIVRKVWSIAHSLGYGQFFLNRDGGHITDDHYFVNTIRGIPTINIIDLRDDTPHGFFPQWHTVDDTMDHIDPFTLKVVGQTVLTTIYRE